MSGLEPNTGQLASQCLVLVIVVLIMEADWVSLLV